MSAIHRNRTLLLAALYSSVIFLSTLIGALLYVEFTCYEKISDWPGIAWICLLGLTYIDSVMIRQLYQVQTAPEKLAC